MKAHILDNRMKGIKKTFFFDPHGNFKTLVARGEMGMKILEKLTCQYVSRDTGHDNIIGTPHTVVSDTR